MNYTTPKLSLIKIICLLLFAGTQAYAQCPVTAAASASTIYCGQSVNLSAYGTPGFYVFTQDFNTGCPGTNWSASSSADCSNPCGGGPSGANPYLWMSSTSTAPRNVTTNNYDVSTGGTICFDMRYSAEEPTEGCAATALTCNCEGPDQPNEGVALQYSLDNGATWIDITYWDPNGGQDSSLINWNRRCVTIPPGAMSTSTMFRWFQEFSSDANSDHWGLDNVTIATNDPNFFFDWTHDGLPPATTSATPAVSPTSSTVYTVNYSDGTSTCSSTVTVNVISPTVSATATPVNICQGASSQLIANSSLVATPPSACGINTYGGCPPNSEAGEPQIGTGTTVASYNSGANYVYGDFGSTGGVRTQIIYRASELIAAGFSAGQITNMQLDVGAIQTNSGTASSVTLNGFTIQIGCTATNAFANSSAWISGLTTVFPATAVTVVTGWNTYNFPNSYNWDGTSNIVVQLCWYNGSSGGSVCAKTRTQPAGFNSMLASYVNASGAALNCATHTSFQTLYTIRPNTRFGTCEPRAITLNYNWAPAGSLSNSTIYNPVASPASTTTYTVSVSESGTPAACAATSTVTVTVVTSNMTGIPGSRCGTGTVNLSTSGCTGTVNWYANASGGSPIGTGSSFTTPSISSTTTFYATCTQFGCESPRVPVVATVNPVPSSAFTISPSSMCAGVNTTITYTGAVIAGSNYSWNFNGGTIVSGSGQGPYTVNWPNPSGGTYNVTLTVTSSAGCASSVTTQTATVSPGPALSITPAAPSYCAPGSVNLTGNTVLNPLNYSTSGVNATDFVVPDNGVTAAWNGSTGTFSTSPINITGLNPSSWNITSVCLNINADKDQEVIVYLRNPCGGLIRLIRNNGGTANTGFNTTCFSPSAVTAISAGTAPFNGTFIPEQGAAAWTAFLACGSPNGTWQLLVGDAATSSPVAGLLTAVTLTNWTINFTSANYITTYLWSPSANLTSTNTASTTASPSVTTTYSLTVTDALGCPASQPVTVTVSNPAAATFSYTGTPYCQNASNPSPAFSGGGTAGTFSSTPGLVFVSTTSGQVNLAASTPGTYTVTNTIAASGGCPAVTATANITITSPPAATFSYTGSPYCQGGSNPSPTFSGGGTAGTFTSTAGLSINAVTGQVNLASSTPGTYTVTNTIASSGGCPAVVATAGITINPSATAAFSYTASPYCQNAADPSPVFSGGGIAGTFSSTAGLVFISTSSGQVDLSASAPGTYTITNTIAASGGCPAVSATANITVTPLPVATFSYTGSPYCQNASNPSPTFSGGGTAGTFTSTAGLSINASTGAVNLSASTAGTYTVTNTIAAANGCPAVTATSSITITTAPAATFSYTASPYCQSGTNPSPAFSGGGTAGTFTSTAGLSINASTGVVNLAASTAGTYTVTNTIAASGGCPAAVATANITINPAPVATFSYTASPYCQSAANPSPTFSGGGTAGTFTSSAGLVFVSASTGQVNLSASAPGTYTVTNTIAAAGGCASATATASITITAPPVATFSYPASPYCQGGANPSPAFSGGGTSGTFSSSPGLVFISTSTGQVNLSGSTPGTYTVTNTIAASGGCPAVSATANITITSPQAPTFSYTGTPYCQNAANPSPTFSAGGVAGTFTSTAGLSINASTGAVNLSASTAGTYTVTNTIAATGGCPAVTATANITITPVQSAAFNYSSSTFCSTGTDPSPTITGTAGGTFTSAPAGLSINASTGLITLSTSTLNTYTVTYTTAGPCGSSSSINVTITNAPAATFSYTGSPYCQAAANPSPAFSGGGTAGTFSASPAGLVFVSTSTGQIDLAASTPGTYTVTNTIPASGGCSAATANSSVTINAGSTASFSYTASPYCQDAADPSPVFSGGGSAGTFSSTAGLSINSATGVVDLSASTAGTYTVTNTIAAASGCPAATASANITITAPQAATFSYTGSPYCQNAANPSPTFSGGGVAGTFSSTAGLSINTASGEVNLAASTPGTYTVTNTLPASGGCPLVTATANITITTVPVATFSYIASPYCQNAANPSPVFSGGGSAGVFTSTAGLSINAATGVVNLSTSTPGTYTVTNTIAASGGCPAVTATANITITPLPVATFSYPASPYCQTAANPSPSYSGGGVAGTFSSTAGLVFVSAATGEVNLAASTPGTYAVTNTIAAASGCPAVTANANITITAPPSATFSYNGTPYCQTGSDPSAIVAAGATAGTFSSTAGLVFINTSTGEIDLSASTPGTYTVTNTIAASGGCAAVTATANISITAPSSATFSYTASPYCQDATNPSPAFSAGSIAGTFTSAAGLVFVSSSTGVVNLAASTAGTYTVTNTISASGGCPTVSATTNITINPVQNAGFNYSAGTFCQSGSNPVATITGTPGGTFSASPSGLVFISTSTGEIDLSASALNTYTIAYTTAGPCAATSTVSVTISNSPSATFSYTASPYCQNAPNPSPVYSGGGTAGTFTSSAGLVFVNSSTGEVDLAASTTGTYTVTNTIAASGGCAAVSATASITISPVQNASFSYPAGTFCQTGSNPAAAITGTPGGTFSAAPGGLVFVSNVTGEIDLAASTLNTYTITYTTAGPCTATSSVNITITNAPSASFSYTASPYCQGGTNPLPSYSGGGTAGTFSATPAGLVFANTSTGEIDLTLSTPGTYTVTNSIAASGGCAAASASFSVTINPGPAATFSYAASPYCQSAANPSPVFSGGATAGTFSAAAGLAFVNSSTGEVNLAASSPGTYTVTNTIAAAGGCPAVTATSNITITAPQTAAFSYTASPYCQNGTDPVATITPGSAAGTFSSSAGLVFINVSTGEIDLSASTAGTYTVTNTVPASGGCASVSSTANITINPVQNAAFNYSGSTFCQTGANPVPVITGATGGVFSSSPAGLNFVSSSTGEINLSTTLLNTYTITYTTPGPCSDTSSVSITITDAPDAAFSYTASPYCQSSADPLPVFAPGASAGIFSSTTGLTFISTSTGQIDLSASTPGTYTVSNNIAASGGCAAASATSNIVISPSQNAGFSYSASSFCQSGSDPIPTITGVSGGTFSSTAGLVFVNTSTGEIDLSASSIGSYNVEYLTPGPCPDSSVVSINITAPPSASFSYSGTPYCTGGTNPLPVIAAGSSSGTFSAGAGLIFISSATGEIDLTNSTAGTYTITNTIPASGGCAAVSATTAVTINPVQNASFSYSGSTFCQTGTDPTPIVTGAPGGTFSSSPAGLVFVSTATGEIDLSASSLNTYTITYTTPGPCASSATASVTISTSPSASFSYTASPYCQSGTDPSPVYSAGGSAGTFTSGPAGLSINPATGIVDLSLSAAGTYTVTNTIAASGGCPASSATTNITITAPQAATFSYPGSPYCQTGTNPSPVFSSGGTAGAFSASPSGLSINSATGLVNLASSSAGTYTVTNTIAASGGCPAVTATSSITVNPLQNASFSYPSAVFCQSSPNPSPSVTGTPGGTFSSSPAGLTINTTTGMITAATSAVNTYAITYTTPGPCANSSTFNVTISPSIVASANAASPLCSGQAINFSAGGGTSYSWDGPALFSSTQQNPVIAPAGAANTGTYTVTVTSGGCTDTAQVYVLVTDIPLVEAGPDVTIAEGGSTNLSATGGISYQWTPAEGLSCTNCPDPVATPSVTTTYCVQSGNGQCTDSDCITVTVDLPCLTNKDLGTPNAFSPNNDGNNDEFCLQGWSACMSQFNIMIFDRWGEKVFEASESDFCWDGTFRGKSLDPAVFVYMIQARFTTGEELTKKGNISIIR